jgi:HEAT repeat protein
VTTPDRNVESRTPAGARRTLTGNDPWLWIAFDAATRSYWERSRDRWPTPHSAAIAACDRSGWVRETAVAEIAEIGDPALWPVLVLRCADWVPQVRSRAREVALRCLAEAPKVAFEAFAPLAFALAKRVEGQWLATVMEEHLRDGSAEVLASALDSPDRVVRRAAFRIGLGRLPVDRLLHAVRFDDDIAIRVRCAEAVIRMGDPDVTRLLLSSGTAGVRAEAVHALGLTGEIDPAEAALTDRNGMVRATAQAVLRRAGRDPAAAYRALLTVSPTAAVIAGLGETGGDAEMLRPYLSHPTARVRVEAVRALRRLGDVPVDLLAPMLADPSPSVTRQVVLSLRERELDMSFLLRHLGVDHPRHIRFAAYLLLRARDTWTRIETNLALLGDAFLGGRARMDVLSWLRNSAATSYLTPTAERATRVDALLRGATTFDEDQVLLMRFHLGLHR